MSQLWRSQRCQCHFIGRGGGVACCFLVGQGHKRELLPAALHFGVLIAPDDGEQHARVWLDFSAQFAAAVWLLAVSGQCVHEHWGCASLALLAAWRCLLCVCVCVGVALFVALWCALVCVRCACVLWGTRQAVSGLGPVQGCMARVGS